eukprot:g20276.t1
MFGPLDTGEDGNGQVLPLCQLQGKVLWGCGKVLGAKREWNKVFQREQSLQKADKGGKGNMSGGGILLEVAEMASDVLLDVNAGGMV